MTLMDIRYEPGGDRQIREGRSIGVVERGQGGNLVRVKEELRRLDEIIGRLSK